MKAKLILCAALSALILTACGSTDNSTDTAPVQEDISAVDEAEPEGGSDALPESEAEENAEQNFDELLSGKFVIKGQEVQFPMTVGEFLTAAGYTTDEDIQEAVSAYDTDSLRVGDPKISIEYENPTNAEITVSECSIYSIRFDTESIANGDIVCPGDINADMLRGACEEKYGDMPIYTKVLTTDPQHGEYSGTNQYADLRFKISDEADSVAAGSPAYHEFYVNSPLSECKFGFAPKDIDGTREYNITSYAAVDMPTSFFVKRLQEDAEPEEGAYVSDDMCGQIALSFSDEGKCADMDEFKSLLDENSDSYKMLVENDNLAVAYLGGELDKGGYVDLVSNYAIYDKGTGMVTSVSSKLAPNDDYISEDDNYPDKIYDEAAEYVANILSTYRAIQ